MLIPTWKKKNSKCHGFEIKEQKERIGSGGFINPLRQLLNIPFPMTFEQGFSKFQGGWSGAVMTAISGFILIRMAVKTDGVNSSDPNKPLYKYSFAVVPLLRNSLSLL